MLRCSVLFQYIEYSHSVSVHLVTLDHDQLCHQNLAANAHPHRPSPWSMHRMCLHCSNCYMPTNLFYAAYVILLLALRGFAGPTDFARSGEQSLLDWIKIEHAGLLFNEY